MISARTPKPAGETPALSSVSSVFSCESSKLKFRGAQPPRLLLGAPSRRTLMWRAYCFDPHPRTAMPTTRASSAAPEAGALPNPLEQGANRENRGAQPPRLLFGAPSRRTFVWRAYCLIRTRAQACRRRGRRRLRPGRARSPIHWNREQTERTEGERSSPGCCSARPRAEPWCGAHTVWIRTRALRCRRRGRRRLRPRRARSPFQQNRSVQFLYRM